MIVKLKDGPLNGVVKEIDDKAQAYMAMLRMDNAKKAPAEARVNFNPVVYCRTGKIEDGAVVFKQK